MQERSRRGSHPPRPSRDRPRQAKLRLEWGPPVCGKARGGRRSGESAPADKKESRKSLMRRNGDASLAQRNLCDILQTF